MNKAFEKILDRMDKASVLRANSKEHFNNPQNGEYVDDVVLMKDAIKIVNEVAEEYNNGWIPMSNWTKVEDALPEPYKDCYVTYEFPSGTRLVVESYLDKKGKWAFLEKNYNKRGAVAPRRAVAWMYKIKPEPYEEDIREVNDNEK